MLGPGGFSKSDKARSLLFSPAQKIASTVNDEIAQRLFWRRACVIHHGALPPGVRKDAFSAQLHDSGHSRRLANGVGQSMPGTEMHALSLASDSRPSSGSVLAVPTSDSRIHTTQSPTTESPPESPSTLVLEPLKTCSTF